MAKDTVALVSYDIGKKTFSYSQYARELFSIKDDSVDFFNDILRHHFLSIFDNNSFMEIFQNICESNSVKEISERFSLKNLDSDLRIFDFQFITAVPLKTVILTMKDVSDNVEYMTHLTRMTEYDELTGLLNLETFKKNVENFLKLSKAIQDDSSYAIIYFDILKFKAINDIFGRSGGDIVLLHIANILKTILENGEFACRIIGDKFAVFVRNNTKDINEFVEKLIRHVTLCELPIQITCNAGVYIINDTTLPASDMLDKAILAQSTIKGVYTQHYKIYTEELRDQMLSEQEIIGSMANALKEGQFIPYFQPQYEHSSGDLVGAEALVRWKHPEKGLIREVHP